jgi:dTDP-4-dehydrorhamnose reductase
MTALITGGTGQVGSALRALFPDADAPGRASLDLSEPEGIVPYLDAHRPSVILNAAAYTAVDRAEQEEQLATTVNGTSVGVLAGWAARRGVPFVTFSTDYVFDGTSPLPYPEDHPVSPINAYGRSKAAGESAALEANPDALIVRTSWVISGTHPNFVATMLRLAPERSLSVVDDQWGCPTINTDLAAAAAGALRAGATGILHLCNQGPTTWYRLGRAALEHAGIDPGRISPCTTADYPTPARRPANSVLASTRLGDLGLPPLPPWRSGLPDLVRRLTA